MSDPVSLGLGLLGGFGSAIGSQISAENYLRGVKETNAANLQIAREQNQANYEQWLRESAWNRQQWQDTNAWNLAQWNRENAYNSPAAQMSRMRAAGINPFAAMGQIQGGLAQGVSTSPAQSASSAPSVGATMQAPSPEAYRTGIPEMLSTIQSMAQMRFVNEQAKSQELRNSTYMLEMLSRLQNMNADTNVKTETARSQIFQNRFNDEMKDYLKRSLIANVANVERNTSWTETQQSALRQKMSLDIASFDLQKQLQQFQMGEQKRMNNFQIKSFYKDLQIRSSQLALQWRLGSSQIDLNSAEYQKKIQEAAGQVIQNRLSFLDEHEKRMLQSTSINYMLNMMRYSQEKSKFESDYPLIGIFGDAAGSWIRRPLK